LTPTKFSYIHSFSITENYAVFFFYPVIIDNAKVLEKNFHVFEAFKWSNETENTDIYVVDLNSGDVKGPFTTPWVYSAHHINAYEDSEEEIVLDLVPAGFFFKAFRLEEMLQPPMLEVETGEAMRALRYTINIETGQVRTATFPNTINNKHIDKFDFPTINENHRGKRYCYTYGVSSCSISRHALVKKNLCNSEEDKVLYRENHYMSEMQFLPNPGGEREDDGVLLTIGMDGNREQSYLLLLDARTFTPINHAFLPHNIPWSAHGLHFPEATWETARGSQPGGHSRDEL